MGTKKRSRSSSQKRVKIVKSKPRRSKTQTREPEVVVEKSSRGRSAANTLGSEVGGSLAGGLYDLASMGLSKIRNMIASKINGNGDYTISSQTPQVNTLVNDQVPKFTAGKSTNSTMFAREEFVCNIYSSATPGAFQIQAFGLNVGLPETFSWLSDIAPSYQQWKPHGIVFEFKSLSSDALNSTNTALGQVIMATDYNCVDMPFTSKQEMEDTDFAVTTKPSRSAIHMIECKRNVGVIGEFYIRTGPTPANTDPRFNDLGVFYIATQGCQGASVLLGELHVSYNMSLLKAIKRPPATGGLSTRLAFVASSATITDTFARAQTQTIIYDNIGVDAKSVANYVIFPSNIPIGTTFKIEYICQGSVTATCVAMVWQIGTGAYAGFANGGLSIPATNAFAGNGNVYEFPFASTTTDRCFSQGIFTYTGGITPALFLVTNASQNPNAPTTCLLTITEVNGSAY